MSEIVALVIGAGEGKRFGSELPKQYRTLAGDTILRRSINLFLNHPQVTSVQAVIHSNHHKLYKDAVGDLPLPKPIIGGSSRQASVALGLESLTNANPEKVLIHDAARPLLDNDLVSRVITELDTSQGAIPVLSVIDTLNRGKG